MWGEAAPVTFANTRGTHGKGGNAKICQHMTAAHVHHQSGLDRHSPSGSQGVDFIKEDDAARQRLCSLEHLCQQALTLAIPLGSHSLQGNIHQCHRGLTCYHPAHTSALSHNRLELQESFLRKLISATMHGCARAETRKVCCGSCYEPWEQQQTCHGAHCLQSPMQLAAVCRPSLSIKLKLCS